MALSLTSAFLFNLLVCCIAITGALPRSSSSGLRSSFRARHRQQSSAACGGELRMANGEITSPQFPNTYPDEVECSWKIIGPQGSRFTLTFLEFELEASHECGYDSVKIYNGPNKDDSQLVSSLCGSQLPDQVESTGPEVLVQFRSDFSVGFKGFKLQFARTGCRHEFRALSGHLESPGHPETHPHSTECSYLIQVPQQYTVNLEFRTFDLETSTVDGDCEYDYVKVFDGATEGATCLGKFCGNSIPGPFRSTSSSLFVKFVADASVSHTGFSADYTTYRRAGQVANLCDVNNGGCSQVCTPTSTPEGRICSCRAGYELAYDEETCRDLDECSINSGDCQQVCVNTPGSYTCGCRTGFALDRNNKTCRVARDECATGQHQCQQLCRNSAVGYYCECHKGYRIGEDRRSCVDVDECKKPQSYHHCSDMCVNTPGSYYCKCKDGYLLSANGRICRDIDECILGGPKCEQLCVNTPGGYHCACYSGYRSTPQIPHQCADIDECAEGTPDCHVCTNTQGSFQCACDEGYLPNDNSTACLDINECAVANGNCSQLCVNTPGGFHCQCEKGYRATDEQSRFCVDVDECAHHSGRGDCDHTCENTRGSFVCSCRPGYVLGEDKLSCIDINECEVENGGCSQKCTNSPGNFSCSCFDGFENIGKNGTDVVCSDIDECTTGDHRCDEGATCHNKQGNYSCQCPEGYYDDWNTCVDIDECDTPQANGCQQVCANTPGSFHCQCRPGYSLAADGKTCPDVDECQLDLCEHECVNSKGSYQCFCPAGYQLAADRHTCEDINECATKNGGCGHQCINVNGSYSCACEDGFELLRDGATCRDINECERNTSCCNQNCVNTEGGYNCTCWQGYVQTSRCQCTDIDECQSRNGGCQQTCSNVAGSYRCSCASGFVVDSEDPSQCNDIDECRVNNGGCQHTCTNTQGTYQCTCKPTFKLQADGHSCGHCPTCEDFETLMQTVDLLKKQVASLEAWRKTVGNGCIEDFVFYPHNSSWKKGECTICACHGSEVQCEPILGCVEPIAPVRGMDTTVRPQTDHVTTEPSGTSSAPPTDDEDEVSSTTDEPEFPTDLFTINKKRHRLQ